MLNPEKNDVDIKKLFIWGGKFYIYDAKGEIIIDYYARLVGDADLNRSRVYALRKSAELRKKLKDANSDEYFAYIADKEIISEEELKTYILLLNSRDFSEKAYKEISVPMPKELNSEASLEEQEKYQAEVDEYPKKVEAALKNKMESLIKKEEEELIALDKETLYKKYLTLAVNDLCEKEMYLTFRDFSTFSGTYSDEQYKEKLFETVEQFLELPAEIKDQFTRNYQTLEIDMSTLKKLREVMPL